MQVLCIIIVFATPIEVLVLQVAEEMYIPSENIMTFLSEYKCVTLKVRKES